jgi:hypothetical protein
MNLTVCTGVLANDDNIEFFKTMHSSNLTGAVCYEVNARCDCGLYPFWCYCGGYFEQKNWAPFKCGQRVNSVCISLFSHSDLKVSQKVL